MSTAQKPQQQLPFPAPASLHESFVMQPVSLPEDLDQMTEIYYSAFQDHPANTFWWSRDRAQMERWLRSRVTKKFADPAVRHYKIVHVESGDIAAWARWDIPEGASGFGEWAGEKGAGLDVTGQVRAESDGAEGKKQPLTAADAPSTAATDAAGEKKEKKPVDAPEGSNPEWCAAFFSALGVMHEKWDAGKMLGLSLIATSPSYQRRGAARALIEPLLLVADAQGLAAYLEATPAGKPVYEKLGFRVVDVINFDVKKITNGEVDIPEPYPLCVMIREPVGGRRTV